MSENKFHNEIAKHLKAGSPVVTAADIKDGIVQKIQLYFESDHEAVMDIISKDDLVQNFPEEEGLFALSQHDGKCTLRKVEMFEGSEDMYFRTDGTRTEADEFGNVPAVAFMEAVEAICSLKL